MKIFQSYGYDSNAPLIEKMKEYLTKDAEGKPQTNRAACGIA